jgi:pimeloyl-ACP methyl ester carboxylesterase
MTPNVVFVHGAWADGSGWNKIIQPLQEAGYNVTSVQLPLTDGATDVATLRSVLAEQPGPTLVVAHSYGGWVTTALGEDAPNVAGIVYVAAFGPDEGETPAAFAALDPQPPGLAALHPDAAGMLWLDPEGFVTGFASGVDPVEAKVLSAGQKPVAAATLLSEEPLGTPAWKSVPTWYLVAESDQIIPPEAQQLFAGRMGAETSTVASGHLPMISHPDVVTDLVLSAAQSLAEA